MKTVSLHTLGCKLNSAETSTIGKQFRERGYTLVDFREPTDVFVLNTCSVTERADRECRQLIRRVRRRSPNAYVIVTGCYAQLRPDDIRSIEGVDLVLGAKEKFNLFDFARTERKESAPKVHVSRISEVNTFGRALSTDLSEQTRAFLKIQDGCDYSCSFCTIPLARGESRSISVEEVWSQAVHIAEAGFREIVLTGVNVGDYGRKSGTDLLSLVRTLVEIEGIKRIRVSSIEPNLLSDDLLEFWLSEPKICKHFHIPLQSGSDRILASMKRRYKTSLYASRIEKIKSKCPDAGIGSDVLVGFPGESPALFEDTYRFLRDLPLSYLHTFTYSERPNTPAVLLDGIVEPRERAERSERLRMLSVRKRRIYNESFVGRDVDVLFEQELQRGLWSGLTEHYLRVNVSLLGEITNQIQRVTIITADNDHCQGEISLKEPQCNLENSPIAHNEVHVP